jgi:hypothetical protein
MPAPAEFKDAFLNAVTAHNVGAKNVAYWRNEGHEVEAPNLPPDTEVLTTAEFTKLMNLVVLPEIAKELGLVAVPQQAVARADGRGGRPDAILRQADPEADLVAWEHEGDIRNSDHEIGNLGAANVPLKVLVTYLRPLPQAPDRAEDWLERYTEAYRQLPADQREGILLVIICKPNGDWEFYAYPGFQRI